MVEGQLMHDILITYIQYASWPTVVLVVLIVLRRQLGRIVEKISLLRAGPVELAFRENIQRQGFTEAQLGILRNLSADEIDLFLVVSFSDDQGYRYQTAIDPVLFRERMYRLRDAGLIGITKEEEEGKKIFHSITPLGRRLRAAIVGSTVELIG